LGQPEPNWAAGGLLAVDDAPSPFPELGDETGSEPSCEDSDVDTRAVPPATVAMMRDPSQLDLGHPTIARRRGAAAGAGVTPGASPPSSNIGASRCAVTKTGCNEPTDCSTLRELTPK
jgi:hypothetical protein